MSDLKRCADCEQSKPLDEFYRQARSRDGRQSKCKQCNHAYNREWMRQNPEKTRERAKRAYQKRRETAIQDQREWRRKHPERARDANLSRYGITGAQYDELLASQGGGCAICGRSEHASGRALGVDHDHKSLAVRGILCINCNTALGLMGDDPDRLLAAAAYLLVRAIRTATTNA